MEMGFINYPIFQKGIFSHIILSYVSVYGKMITKWALLRNTSLFTDTYVNMAYWSFVCNLYVNGMQYKFCSQKVKIISMYLAYLFIKRLQAASSNSQLKLNKNRLDHKKKY